MFPTDSELSNIPSPTWITTEQALKEHCNRWLDEPFVAMDTEFVRTTTFYPIAGLIQVADRLGCYLIDPLCIDDWTPFAELLRSSVPKVFHACLEDMEVCRRLTGQLPTSILDTQTAIALLGYGSSMGFQRAVGTFLDIELDKGETRSNWLQRPLTSEQLDYAVADVWFLHHLFPLLEEKLRKMGRFEWLTEEGDRLIKQVNDSENHNEQYYRKVKLAWKLRNKEQYLLQQLCIWREKEARLKDVPRNKIIDDSTLWNIARFKSDRRDSLIKSGVKGTAIKAYSDLLISIVQTSMNASPDDWPALIEKPLSITASGKMKKIKRVIQREAERHGIPPELLANKKTIIEIIRRQQANDSFEVIVSSLLAGWRRELLTETVLNELAEFDNS